MNKLAFIFISLIALSVCKEIKFNKSKQIKLVLAEFMDKPPDDLFTIWHFLFKKTYGLTSNEGERRLKIFKKRVEYIKKHNARNLSYKMGLNKFSDLTNKEFR